MPELKQTLGTTVDTTVFCKLKELSYHSSYSHRGRFYTLAEIPQLIPTACGPFRPSGSLVGARWCRPSKPLSTARPKAYFDNELQQLLHVEAKDRLLQLFEQEHIARQQVSGLFSVLLPGYGGASPPTPGPPGALGYPRQRGRLSLSEGVESFSGSLLQAARRATAPFVCGLESLKFGRGGDQKVAALLPLDPHTVARGRKELLAQDVESERVRKPGGGRKPTEKTTEVIDEIERLLDNETGDPMSNWRWTHKTTIKIAGQLQRLGIRFWRQGDPIISVAAKKRELVGNFKNAGVKWERVATQVNDHDFRSLSSGIALLLRVKG